MGLIAPDISEFNQLRRDVDDLKQLVIELRQELKAHIGKKDLHKANLSL